MPKFVGIGNLVLQAALETSSRRSIGIEVHEERSKIAKVQITEYKLKSVP